MTRSVNPGLNISNRTLPGSQPPKLTSQDKSFKTADIRVYDQENSTYKHRYIRFENLNRTISFGPAGGKYDGSITRAPGRIDPQQYTAAQGRLRQNIPATKAEEQKAWNALQREVVPNWRNRDYNTGGSSCYDFVRDAVNTIQNSLGKGANFMGGY